MNGDSSTTVEGHLTVDGKSRPFIVISVRAAAVILIGVLASISVGFSVGFWKIENITHDYVHRIAVAQCATGNDSRANDLSAWEELRALVGDDDPRADKFIADIRKKDAQRVLLGDTCALPPSRPTPTSPTTGAP